MRAIESSIREAWTFLKLMNARHGIKYKHVYGVELQAADMRVSYKVTAREKERFIKVYNELFDEVDKMDEEVKKKMDANKEAYIDKINRDADAYIEGTRYGKADYKKAGPVADKKGGVPPAVVGIGVAAVALALIASFNS